MPQLTVEDNLFLGAEPRKHGFLDRQALRREAKAILSRLGFALDPAATVQHLTRAQQQMVEIAKAFRTQPSVLILDEPTASLTERETEQLFALIRRGYRTGCGRHLHHPSHGRDPAHRRSGDGAARRPCDRHGGCQGHFRRSAGRADDRPRHQRDLSNHPPRSPESACSGSKGSPPSSQSVRDATIEVRAGEIVGIAGLVGSGKSELARACFGLEAVAAGRVWLRGRRGHRPAAARHAAERDSSICRPTAARKG